MSDSESLPAALRGRGAASALPPRSPPNRGRWGRLKRSSSHDECEVSRSSPAAIVCNKQQQQSPRHLFKKGGAGHQVSALDLATTSSRASNNKSTRVFLRRRINTGGLSPQDKNNNSNNSDIIPRRTSSSLFGRHREKRRGGTTHQPDDDGAAAGMGDMNNNNNNNYEENASEFDGMSSDENPDHDTVNSNANCSSLPDTPSRKMMGFRSMNQRGRRQFQQQQQHQQSSQAASLGDAGTTTGHQRSALRGGGSGCGAAGASAGGSNSRAESVPMRKMVSFDTGGVADQDTAAAAAASNPPARIRAHSSDELQQEKAETDENLTAAVNHIASFGYNTFDFPMPRQTPTATTKALGYSLTTQSGSQLQSQHLSLHQQQQQPRGETRQQQRERARYSIYHGNSTVKKKFRVRPFHCFPDETVHMTEEDIYTDSLTPSKEFVSLKSYLAPSTASRSTGAAELPDSIRHIWGSPEQDGRIGALRVEVLGCVSLNRTKPDVTVYMVCGDSAFCTDGLTGFRSPMWPSVSRRACVFPIHHAYAKLYVGVFDVRVRKNKENDVFCGRVVIDVASIRPNTEYDTTMPLRASTFVYDKRKRGVIRLRFSLHWFNERAAVVSYFKSVKSLVDSCPLVEGQPTIPCADPKTFRNVAVTVYGQDLPGKYSRNAFRSTMREFNLYQQNLQLLVKVLVLDAMLYEKPWMSFYLFGGAMYCIIFNTVAMVPAFLVGYILILYLENYRHFVEDKDFHLGYKPLTIVEVFMALVLNSTNDKGAKQISLKAIAVEKRTKRRRGQQAAPQRLGRAASKEDLDIGATAEDEENCGEIVPLDHREFPFADRDAYPKFSVEDSLAPGSSKGGTGRLHGRLSVYYTAAAPTAESGSVGEDESEMDSERDDETVMTESQMVGDTMFDLESEGEEEEEMNMEGVDFNYKRAMTHQSSGVITSKRRLRLGPPQDTDVSGRKVPPQLQLKKVETLLYKLSRGISVELVHAPPLAEQTVTAPVDVAATGMIPPSAEVQANVMKKARKLTYDDFDKLLGLQSRTGNPIHRIMSSFMGPLMRMIRVGVYLIRISFNVTTWRDPYLSFWVLVMLSSLCLLLIVFPWRLFFLASSVVCLGPQNVFVRRYLEKKAAAKEKLSLDDGDDEVDPLPDKRLDRRGEITRQQSTRFGRSREHGLDDSNNSKEKVDDKTEARRGFFSKRRQNGKVKKPGSNLEGEEVSQIVERPAFQSVQHGQSSANKKLQPRAVAIPYSRLRKERFYDWPPDPTVSRATPIALYPETTDDLDDSLTASVPDFTMPDHEDYPSTLRRRNSSSGPGPADIPTNIAF